MYLLGKIICKKFNKYRIFKIGVGIFIKNLNLHIVTAILMSIASMVKLRVSECILVLILRKASIISYLETGKIQSLQITITVFSGLYILN